MNDQDKTKQQLIEELAELRQRVAALKVSESEWQRTQQALQESEERFRLLVEAIPQPIWRSDADGNVIEFNRRWYEYTGQTAEEAKGSGWAKAVHADETAMVVGKVRAGITSGVAIEIVNRLRQASDGSYRWHLARAIPMNDGNGKIIGWFGCATDIDDQKRAEEALAEREARLLEAQEVADLGFHFVDLTTGHITTSPILDRIFGIPTDYERTLDKWGNVLHPDDRQEILDYFKAVVGEKKPFDREYRIIRYGDKQVRWIHGLGRLQFNEDGQPISMLGTIQDITDRKRTETALRESEGCYRALAESTRDIIFVLDRQGTLLYANQAASQCIGIRSADIVGRRQVDLFPPEMARSQIEKTGQVFATGEVIEYEDLFHFGPEEIWLRIHLLPIRGETGNITSVMGVCHNITERKRAEEALQQAHDELEAKVKERTAELSTANEQLKWEVEERRQAEKALEQSERQFRNYFEQGLIGMAVTSPDKRWLLVNDRLCDILGYPREELTQRTWDEITHPDDLEQNLQLFNRLLAGESEHFTFDKRYLKKDGTIVHTTIHTRVLRKDDGSIDHVVVLVEDITARKQAEDALRTSEEKYRGVVEACPDAIVMSDLNGQVLFASRQAWGLLGLADSDELVGRSVFDYVVENDRKQLAVNLSNVVKVGVRRSTEYTALREDGTTVPAEASSTVIRDLDERPKAVMAVIRDITNRKQAEETLRASEERFRSYFEQGLIGMAVSLPDRRWLQVNDRYCDMLGYSREELLGMKWTDLTHPDDLDRNIVPANRMLAGAIEHHTIDKRFLRKDGSIMYATVFARCFRGQDGSVDHFLSLIEDITERKKAEEALERERQSLWRMLQASDHERQTISYEIHDGLAQYLAGATMQFQAHDSLKEGSPKKARKAYETAVELVYQAHMEARRLVSEVRPPIIDEIGLETAISHLVHEQRQRGRPTIKFDSDVQFGRLPAILENAIYRIAQEALTNACKHSKSKKVTVTMSQEGQDVRLEVRDNGIGFDPESVEQGHFGLEGIRQRVRLLGGRLTIESKPGSGTLVQVVVPIVEKQNEG